MTQQEERQSGDRSSVDPIAAIERSGQRYRMSLWVLQLDAEAPPGRLVHGNVLRSRAEERATGWTSFEVKKFGSKARLVRYGIVLETGTCFAILAKLESGALLDEALAESSLVPEGWEGGDIGTLTLQRLPTAYMSGVPQLSVLPPNLWARSSPVNGAGCYCARFVPKNRFAFLPSDSDASEALLLKLCDVLKTETGLSFDQNAGDAFGSIEVYLFPSLDAAEKPRVEIRYAKSPSRAVTVKIRPEESDAAFALQIRGEQVRDIASDELHLVDQRTQELTLDLPDPIDGVIIRVWKKTGNTGAWLLWHEQEDHFLRSIGTSMQLSGLTGSVGAGWLESLPKRLSSRVERFKQIRQVSMDSPMETTSRGGWETGIQNARKLSSASEKMKSSARFFPRGWGSDENKFEFAEWLKEELSSSAGSIILVDPYFDLLGLDLICRASGAANQLTVLTCTQALSEDDEAGTPRAERLGKAAKEYISILRGLKLKICDLRSANSGKSTKQLFHDRYLLFLDEAGNAEKGYNLSTSLQSAATTSPILITEINRSVLDDVADFVFGLMKPQADYVLDVVFPTESANKKRRSSLALTEERASTIVAALDVAGRKTGSNSALEQLNTLGLYSDQKVNCEFTDGELEKLILTLTSSPLSQAAKIWDGMVETGMSRWSGVIPELITRLLASGSTSALGDFLGEYLVGHATGELLAEDSYEHTRTLAGPLKLSFDRAMGQSARFYDHHHEFPLGTTWAIRFALIYLTSRGPEGVDKLVDNLHTRKVNAEKVFSRLSGPKDSRPSKQESGEASRVLANADAILSATVAALTWFVQPPGPGLLETFGQAQLPFARALWATALIRRVSKAEPSLEPDDFLKELAVLPKEELRLSLAQLIYDLRLKANQAQARSELVDELPEWLRNAVVDNADQNTTVEELVRLIDFYSGPVVPNWAPSTHEDLLLPLVVEGKLAKSSLFQVWDSVLTTRRQDEYLGRADFPLLQVWGLAAQVLPGEECREMLQTDEGILEKAERILKEPLLAHRNYKRWSQALNDVLWVLLRAWAIGRTCPNDPLGKVALQLARGAAALAENEGLVLNAIGEMQRTAEYIIEDLKNYS